MMQRSSIARLPTIRRSGQRVHHLQQPPRRRVRRGEALVTAIRAPAALVGVDASFAGILGTGELQAFVARGFGDLRRRVHRTRTAEQHIGSTIWSGRRGSTLTALALCGEPDAQAPDDRRRTVGHRRCDARRPYPPSAVSSSLRSFATILKSISRRCGQRHGCAATSAIGDAISYLVTAFSSLTRRSGAGRTPDRCDRHASRHDARSSGGRWPPRYAFDPARQVSRPAVLLGLGEAARCRRRSRRCRMVPDHDRSWRSMIFSAGTAIGASSPCRSSPRDGVATGAPAFS